VVPLGVAIGIEFCRQYIKCRLLHFIEGSIYVKDFGNGVWFTWNLEVAGSSKTVIPVDQTTQNTVMSMVLKNI
jgi:hypothetical protein